MILGGLVLSYRVFSAITSYKSVKIFFFFGAAKDAYHNTNRSVGLVESRLSNVKCEQSVSLVMRLRVVG